MPSRGFVAIPVGVPPIKIGASQSLHVIGHNGGDPNVRPRNDLPDFFGPLISGKMALLGKPRADEKEPI